MVGAMSLLASLFGAGKSGSAPPGPVSSVTRSDGSKRSGGSAAVNAVDLGEMRAKAATDKLRVVNEAIAEHDTYLATLAIYERLITVYRAKKAGLEALAAARGAMRDAVDAVTTPRAGNTETNGANEEKGTGTRYEVSPEELLEQLGPEPKPPAQRSPVNESRVAADGTEGPPIFLLACAALEGSTDALRMVPELLKRGADANARGTRHDHGADVPALCLVVGAMEGAAKIVAASEAEAEHVVNDAEHAVTGTREDSQDSQAPRPTRTRPASADDLADFATALLAAPNLDVDAKGRLGRVHESAGNGDLNAPYRGLVPYRGRVGAEGTALFLATCAVTANALDGDPRGAVAAVHVAARLMSSGADVNAIGARPGWWARCGAKLTPVSMCLAALEQTASLTDRAAYVSSRVAIASLASALIRGNDFDHAIEATFSHRPDADELRLRRVAPGDASTTPLAPGSTFQNKLGSSNFGSIAPGLPVYASGPALWHACCAVVEGAGAPSLSLALELLETGADPNCVGSRPGHCAAGTPVLAMCVAALEGRAAEDRKKAWWPSTDGVAGSRVPSTLSVRASVSDGGLTDGGSAPATSSSRRDASGGVSKLHPVDGEETSETGSEAEPREEISWMARMIQSAADTAAEIGEDFASLQRNIADAAADVVNAAAAAVGTTLDSHDDRERRARLDALELVKALIARGANVNVPMEIRRPCAEDLITRNAYPLGVALGVYVEKPEITEALAAAVKLLDSGADVNAIGVANYPVVAPPLHVACVAVHKDLPLSAMLFDRILEAGADPSACAVFPEGSECPPVVELLHALREGERDRVLIASMIERLIEAGADVVSSHPEVYLPEPHPAYAAKERDFGAAGDDQPTDDPMDTNGSDVDAESALGRSARRQAASFVDVGSGAGSVSGSSDSEGDVSMAEASDDQRDGENVGATRPKHRTRVGTCEYTPLFWALEAVYGEGHDEARQCVEWIVERRGWEVDETQGLNHQSWVQGSLVACAVAAAVEAAAPIDELSIPPPQSAAVDPKAAGDETSPPLASLLEGWTGAAATDAARAKIPGAPMATNDRADVDEGPVDNVERAFRDPAYHHPASLIHHFPDIAHHNLLLERTREEMPQTKPIQKIVKLGALGRFRGRTKGILGASRFDKAARGRFAPVEKDERSAHFTEAEAAASAADRPAEISAEEAKAGAAERASPTSIPAATPPTDDADPPRALTARDAALHADIDAMGAPSQAGDDVAIDPGGLTNASEEPSAPEYVPFDPVAHKAGALARRSSRLSACIKTANVMVRHSKRVDAGAVNPLLAELGAGSLAPFEFTPLFAALHGAACARGREQLVVALHFATTLLDRGASVVGEDNSGRHAPLEGVGAKNGRNLKGGDSTASVSALRSYPLMWATAAVLRSDYPYHKVDDACALVKRLLVAGADPSEVNLRVSVPDDETESKPGFKRASIERGSKEETGLTRGARVLHLWDERALLLEIHSADAWQRAVTLRMKLAEMLSQAGARSVFRPATRPGDLAATALAAEARNRDRFESDDGVTWTKDEVDAAALMDRASVPTRYHGWRRPADDDEAGPRDDRLFSRGDLFRDLRGRHADEVPGYGAPAIVPGATRIVVLNEKDEGKAGVVDTKKVSRDELVNERDVPVGVLASRMTIEADAKVALDRRYAAEARDAVRDLLGRDNDSDTDNSDTDDEYDNYHRANDDRNVAKAKTRAQLAREKWRKGMEVVAHNRTRSDRIALRQMRSSDASDKNRSMGEMARMALEGLREVVATNVTALRLGSDLGGGDEVRYFDDDADWLASSSAMGRRRRQPTVRRELYGPHTERL